MLNAPPKKRVLKLKKDENRESLRVKKKAAKIDEQPDLRGAAGEVPTPRFQTQQKQSGTAHNTLLATPPNFLYLSQR